ncbi:phage tail tube protein [Acinetobacter sp. ANC 5502]
MAKLRVQGSRWWAFDGTTLIRLVCLKTFDPGSDSAGKIEITCLDEEETKSYIPGLSDPGDGSMGFDIDTENASHLQIVQWATEKKALTIIQGGTDSQSIPTVTAGVLDALPTDRTWWKFDASLTTPVWKFDADTLVNCTVTMQRKSATKWIPKT